MKVNHIGIVVKNLEKSIKYYEEYFSLRLINPISVDPIQKVRVAFLKQSGQQFNFELLEPTSDDSPVMNALKKGGGLNHICYEVENITNAISYFPRKGSKLISGPDRAVTFEGRYVAFLFTKGNEVIEIVKV